MSKELTKSNGTNAVVSAKSEQGVKALDTETVWKRDGIPVSDLAKFGREGYNGKKSKKVKKQAGRWNYEYLARAMSELTPHKKDNGEEDCPTLTINKDTVNTPKCLPKGEYEIGDKPIKYYQKSGNGRWVLRHDKIDMFFTRYGKQINDLILGYEEERELERNNKKELTKLKRQLKGIPQAEIERMALEALKRERGIR